MKSPFLYLIPALVLGLRYIQAEGDFRAQEAVFPQALKGSFRVWVREEPEVLFERPPGSHDTGRLGGGYLPLVREVRAVCTLVSVITERPTEVATPPNAPIGAAPRNDGHKMLPPIKVRCTLRLSPGFSQPVLSYGDVLEVEGKIQAPPPVLNPGQFDYAHYLKTKGVPYVLYAQPGKWRKRPAETSVGAVKDLPHGSFLPRWSYGLKRWCEDTIYRHLPFPESALLDGILLGERTPLPDEVVQSFFLTGTIHILAVSGMITAFVAGLFFMVLRALQLPRKGAAGLTLAGLVFFVVMTGAHPPVCRAALFSGLALLSVLFERRIRGGVLLLSTAALLTAFNPFVLEDLSFQISFLATAGLMVMAPWMMKKLSFLWTPAALLLTATTAAQLAVWCLVIYDFNQLSVYSILSNLLIVPLALFSAAGGLALLAGALVHPALGELFGAACEAPLKLLLFLADSLARLPKAEWIIASPPLPWVLAFHALLLVSFLWFWPEPVPEKPSEGWKRRRAFFSKGRVWTGRAWALFLALSLAAWGASLLGKKPLRITFLAVGHGNAVVLRSPGGKTLVVDGGKETHGPDRYSLVVSYLRHEGIQRVEGVLNTHPDEDHVGGLVNVLSAYPVESAYEGDQARSDSAIYQKFKQTIGQRQVRYSPLKEGERLSELEPAQTRILHPADGYRPRLHADNNRSLVSLVSFGGMNLMLPGDLEKDGILHLLKDNRPFPRVDWLMAPHHGRSSGEPLLCAKAFQPRFVVLSDWRDYPDDHAFFQSAVPGAVVLSTAQEGEVELELGSDGKGRYRTFRHREWKKFSPQSTVGSPQ